MIGLSFHSTIDSSNVQNKSFIAHSSVKCAN